ncbi:hypothetical protein GGR72_000185 [Xanthomonas arboricola]|nr:hypothetical protein [Xanthomonas arboricola]
MTGVDGDHVGMQAGARGRSCRNGRLGGIGCGQQCTTGHSSKIDHYCTVLPARRGCQRLCQIEHHAQPIAMRAATDGNDCETVRQWIDLRWLRRNARQVDDQARWIGQAKAAVGDLRTQCEPKSQSRALTLQIATAQQRLRLRVDQVRRQHQGGTDGVQHLPPPHRANPGRSTWPPRHFEHGRFGMVTRQTTLCGKERDTA